MRPLFQIIVVAWIISGSLLRVEAAASSKEIYQRSYRSVVLIITYDSRSLPLAIGSGFFSGTNEITTNFHVIDGASRIVCRGINEKTSRTVKQVKAFSKSIDLALLEVEESGVPLSVKASPLPGIGEKVVAIGNPRGLEGSLSDGIVSGIRSIDTLELIQITAAISPGSSGGPVFDEQGDVIGIATMTLLQSQNLNFAIPAKLIDTLRKNGKNWEPIPLEKAVVVERGSAGLSLIDPNFDGPLSGALGYSIKNSNSRPIKNVTYLLVFRNSKSQEVVHFATYTILDTIPPGLAVRRQHEIVGGTAIREMKGYVLEGQSTYPYRIGDGRLVAFCTMELRPLTFDFVSNSPEDELLNSLNK